MSIASDKQKLLPGRRVELFDLDLTLFQEGLVYHFCSIGETGSPDITPLVWRGHSYTPIPVMAEGFEFSGQGSLPTPSLKFANVGLLGSSIIHEF